MPAEITRIVTTPVSHRGEVVEALGKEFVGQAILHEYLRMDTRWHE
jgi:hypothetical protein